MKATYGLVGNDAIGSDNDRFYYLSQVDMNAERWVNWGTQLNYNPRGINVSRYANDKIGWETAYKLNLGAEIATVYGWSANIDVFHERRENILLDRIIPATMGVIPAVKANLGKASGQGVDVELNYEKVSIKTCGLQVVQPSHMQPAKLMNGKNRIIVLPMGVESREIVRSDVGYIAERLYVDDLEVENSTQFGDYMAGDIKYQVM